MGLLYHLKSKFEKIKTFKTWSLIKNLNFLSYPNAMRLGGNEYIRIKTKLWNILLLTNFEDVSFFLLRIQYINTHLIYLFSGH